MGCDIHIHSEIKVKGAWHHYAMPDCDRNYALFSRMAGVRGDQEPLAQPRGIPRNATFVTKLDAKRWGSDGHSHSWLSSHDINQLAKWAKDRGDGLATRTWDQWLFGNCYSDFIEYPKDRLKGLEDVRFVFWFDN